MAKKAKFSKRSLSKAISEYRRCATAVGYLCFAWSDLERAVDLFFIDLLGIDNKDVTETLTSNIDFREKIRIVVGLSYLKRAPKEWFNYAKEYFDQIDNDLRVRRNRMIHDHWDAGFDGIITRTQNKTGFRKSQAFQLEYYTKVVESVDEDRVYALAGEIQDMAIRLRLLSVGPIEGDDDHWKKLIEKFSRQLPHDSAQNDSHQEHASSKRRRRSRSSSK